MSIASADLIKAIHTAWDASTLSTTFQALWPSDSQNSEFFELLDQEAPGGQPFPYAVTDETTSVTVNRMSGGVTSLREVRDIEVRINVFATDVDGDNRTSKEIAAYLAEEIMKVFGGHPTVNPTATITLDNGNHLITEYQNDFGVRTADDFFQWVVIYLFRIDVPVAV
jgi:hypothetical protein